MKTLIILSLSYSTLLFSNESDDQEKIQKLLKIISDKHNIEITIPPCEQKKAECPPPSEYISPLLGFISQGRTYNLEKRILPGGNKIKIVFDFNKHGSNFVSGNSLVIKPEDGSVRKIVHHLAFNFPRNDIEIQRDAFLSVSEMIDKKIDEMIEKLKPKQLVGHYFHSGEQNNLNVIHSHRDISVYRRKEAYYALSYLLEHKSVGEQEALADQVNLDYYSQVGNRIVRERLKNDSEISFTALFAEHVKQNLEKEQNRIDELYDDSDRFLKRKEIYEQLKDEGFDVVPVARDSIRIKKSTKQE